jgi:galactokinase/mevalonate kinase-like predicted kinase
VRPARGRAFARAALAGNPSDGYGGRTLAVVVREFAAEAEVAPAPADAFAGPAEELVRAALVRFRAEVADIGPVEVRCSTIVPREVGLAGSSAIVIAVLRALAHATDAALEPGALARMALAVEAEDLGIAAGLQDRLVQTHEGLLAMDFGPDGGVEALDPALLPALYVAWRADAAAPSGRVHGALRERWSRGDDGLRAAMAELADHAAAARDALVAGDAAAFAACVDGSLDVRRRVMPVDPRVLRMAEVAREHGASANSAGSGGAIVGTLPAGDAWPDLERALRAEGCAVARPRL